MGFLICLAFSSRVKGLNFLPSAFAFVISSNLVCHLLCSLNNASALFKSAFALSAFSNNASLPGILPVNCLYLNWASALIRVIDLPSAQGAAIPANANTVPAANLSSNGAFHPVVKNPVAPNIAILGNTCIPLAI